MRMYPTGIIMLSKCDQFADLINIVLLHTLCIRNALMIRHFLKKELNVFSGEKLHPFSKQNFKIRICL